MDNLIVIVETESHHAIDSPVCATEPRLRDRVTMLFFVSAARLVLVGVGAIAAHRRKKHPKQDFAVLAIDAGVVAWEFIEYKELAASATDLLGVDHVVALSIHNKKRYPAEVRRFLRKHPHVTHYFYDPRSGSDRLIGGFLQSLQIAILLHYRNIVPIARVTDVPVRRWRLRVSIVTASRGVCCILMAPKQVRSFFPHNRLVGPLPMAISRSTLGWLADERARISTEIEGCDAVFSGSLYEPRSSFIRSAKDSLKQSGIELQVLARQIGGERAPNIEYWHRFVRAKTTLTTADQVVGQGIDNFNEPHLIYRYTEALAAGAALVAPAIPAAAHIFRPGLDYFPCGSAEEAADAIVQLCREHDMRQSMTESGFNRVRWLVESNYYWTTIDSALGVNGFNVN